MGLRAACRCRARRALRRVAELREQIASALRSLRFTVHLIEGRTPGGHALRILYSGSAPLRHYLCRRALAAGCREQPLGRRWRWQLRALAQRTSADLAITRSARALCRFSPPRAGAFYVPEWVWCELALGPKWAATTGKSWWPIRKHHLTSEIVTDEAALRRFHERMYVPMIRASHGDGAQLMGLDYLLRRVREGEAELVSVLKDGRPVGGCVVVYDEGGARLFSQGVLDADRDLLRQAVGTANILFSLKRAHELGYSRVNLGRSRPFLDDGALRFKLSRRATITGATHAGIEIEPLRGGPGVGDFLCRNPWIGEDAGGLVATFFAAGSSRLDAPAPPSGVRRVAVVPLEAAGERGGPVPARAAPLRPAPDA